MTQMTTASFQGTGVREVTLTCPKHGAYMVEQCFVAGRLAHTPECPKCKADRLASPEYQAEVARAKAEAEELERKRQQAAKHEAYMSACRKSNVPASFVGKLLKDFTVTNEHLRESLRQARLYVDNFEKVAEKGVGFCLYGNCGTGKTMLACAILQELFDRVQGLYAPMWDVLRAIRKADSFKSDMDDYNRLVRAPLLVIDEVGVQNGSSFEESQLMSLLDERYSRRLPTIFVTNLLPDEKDQAKSASNPNTLRAKLGERLFNRILGSSVFLYFKGESQRRRIMKIDEVI